MSIRRLFKASALGALVGSIALATASAFGAPAKVEVVKDPTKAPAKASALDFTVKDIEGKEQRLAEFKGKVVMFVNVASKCGFTKQYAGLESLYAKYKDQGLVVIGFPANNFKGQEPGTDADIQKFCRVDKQVTFPLMAKISVLGEDKAPVYKFLTEKETAGDFAGDVTWNFNKFLVDRNGNVFARFPSQTTPEDGKLVESIEKALKAKATEAAATAAK